MARKPKTIANKPKTVAKSRAELRRSTQRSIFPAQVLSPDQRVRASVKVIAARHLELIEERINELEPEAVIEGAASMAKFLKDVTSALKTVQDMEHAEASDLTGMSDEDLDAELAKAEEREAVTTARLMKALPKGDVE